MLRALIDSGALRFDGDRWVADTDIAEMEIPNTLLATVMARIDRLPAGVRRTLQVAAVIGREVSEKVLRRVADSGPELDRHLREALRAGLLREEAVIPERRYAFTQSLIHEAAARSLLVRRRKEIHVQVGWALEEIYADNLERGTASSPATSGRASRGSGRSATAAWPPSRPPPPSPTTRRSRRSRWRSIGRAVGGRRRAEGRRAAGGASRRHRRRSASTRRRWPTTKRPSSTTWMR